MNFEWDPGKAAENLRRHGVSFEEAVSVFGDALARTYADPGHAEAREVTFGITSAGRAIVVVHCERGNRTRIISARAMTRREKRNHEEGTW